MTIDNLEIQIKSSTQQASYGVDKLTRSVSQLKNITKGGAGLNTLANQLNRLNTALAGISTPTAKIQSMVNAINRLSSVSTSASSKADGLSRMIKELNKLPKLATSLKEADMEGFAQSINRVATAIRPLATEMEKVSRGFSALPTKIQQVIRQNERLNSSNRRTSKSYGILGTGISGWMVRLTAGIAATRAIGNVIGGWIQKSNEYVENLNLFTVALGDYAEEAKEYAETVGKIMGIDPSDWLRAQGIFNTLATGFGISSDKAAIMSKNLTQLSYDLSSFYNIKVDDAMTKLQSAFSGELEPVRRLGYDLSQTKLQAIATSQGITKNIAEMNQAEKSMIRYYALMTQVTTAQGDMARTLNAPANQLRIFNAQVQQLSRALGNIFIPALNAILPYLIAFVKVLRGIADAIAKLFNYQLPEVDYSNVSKLGTEAEGVANGFDDATKAAKKLKSFTAGFDELNILNDDNDGSGVGNGLNGAGSDLNVPEYNFLGALTEANVNEKFEEMKGKLALIVGLIAGALVGLLAWKLTLLTISGTLSATLLKVALMVSLVLGFALLLGGAFMAWTTGVDWDNLILMLAGIALIVVGLGANIGLIVGGIVLLAVGIKDAYQNGLSWQNLTAIFLGIAAIVTVLALSFGAVGAAIALVVGGVALLVLGIRDLVMSGANSQNLTAIYVGLIAITVALTLAFGWIGLIIGLVIALAVSFVLFADKVMAALYVVGAFFKNVGLWIANVGLAAWEAIKNVGKFFGNVGLAIWETLKAVAHNIATAFIMAWLNIKKGFVTFKEVVMSGVKAIADKANDLLGIFGVNLDLSGIESQLQQIRNEKAEIQSELDAQEFKSIGEALKEGFATYTYGSVGEAFETFEVFDEGWNEEAWSAGEEVGANFKDGIMSKLKGVFGGGEETEFTAIGGDLNIGLDKESLTSSFNASDMNLNLDSMNELQAQSLATANNTDTNIASLTETSLGEALTVDKDQLASLKDLDTHATTNKTETISAIQHLSSYIGSKLDEVRRACENIKINITKVYSGGGEYASGGFPTKGDMFIANEAGPELVGRIGNRTAVANNDQITQGIAQAVYSAMVNANQANGGTQSFNVYIEGKQVNAAVEKVKRDKGTSIMTGGLIYG